MITIRNCKAGVCYFIWSRFDFSQNDMEVDFVLKQLFSFTLEVSFG